ncbi:MAG: CBS domain-containing protein [Anaerolineales bacterium]
MHIILTHDQADFDAVASLLGAAFLFPGSVPVLPRKVNRNVRGFLTLYGSDLPFIELRDLPSEPVDQITLVDTQSLATIKGVRSDTHIQVIDHHPLREDIPSNWSITVASTGANTTLIIELLQNRELQLTSIESTLLLLGIYEDTGALTYSRTTARDLEAAAFLLGQGASLSILANYLNHPLTDEQKKIFDTLQQNLETIDVNGHRIVIAQVDVGVMDEELSTVAHKLRDIIEGDALFVLAKIKSGVQLIARSTSDSIDVAIIANQFGGGGHERAAAGLIRDESIEQVKSTLIQLLPNFVKPAINVGQIMSNDPQIIPPDTGVGQIAELMQRFGHEGFPVVEQNRVVGLVTRRAVDRAISHKLNLTARQIMEPGEITVTPDDSLEYLQLVMTRSGWGQIPVKDPQSGEIIGIVTRTDVLRTLPIGNKMVSRLNLSARLEKMLPPAQIALIKVVAQVASAANYALFIVGGFVRDLLLEKPSMDFDLVVEGDAIGLARAIYKRYGGRITTHSKFKTAKWMIDKNSKTLFEDINHLGNTEIKLLNQIPNALDFVTARTEFYPHPTALPLVEPGSIKLDLHRRDFTINTLALRLDGIHYGELYDYWGGLNDLRKGLVRVLHSLSFVDDPTRILRAVRFEQRFHFQIENRTLQLLMEAKELLGRISGDRIRHELDLIFIEENACNMLMRLSELGILNIIHPSFVWDEWAQSQSKKIEHGIFVRGLDINNRESDTRRILFYILLTMRSDLNTIEDLSQKLRIPARIKRLLLDTNRLWKEQQTLREDDVRSILTVLEGAHPLSLFAIILFSMDQEIRRNIENYLNDWSKIKCITDSQKLKKLGIPAGPLYRKIFSELRFARIEGKVRTEDDELKLINQILTKTKAGNE